MFGVHLYHCLGLTPWSPRSLQFNLCGLVLTMLPVSAGNWTSSLVRGDHLHIPGCSFGEKHNSFLGSARMCDRATDQKCKLHLLQSPPVTLFPVSRSCDTWTSTPPGSSQEIIALTQAMVCRHSASLPGIIIRKLVNFWVPLELWKYFLVPHLILKIL